MKDIRTINWENSVGSADQLQIENQALKSTNWVLIGIIGVALLISGYYVYVQNKKEKKYYIE